MRRQPHADSAVRAAETWLAKNGRQPNAVSAAVAAAGIPEGSLKRRFKAATGATLIDFLHNLRIEDAERHLETGLLSFDEISAEVCYENVALFCSIFKRSTGLTLGEYRRMLRPLTSVIERAVSSDAPSRFHGVSAAENSSKA